jgi:GTP-binding protein HflX
LKALNRLTTRRFPATDVYTIDQARELSLLSRALGRQLGMLIDRKGRDANRRNDTNTLWMYRRATK